MLCSVNENVYHYHKAGRGTPSRKKSWFLLFLSSFNCPESFGPETHPPLQRCHTRKVSDPGDPNQSKLEVWVPLSTYFCAKEPHPVSCSLGLLGRITYIFNVSSFLFVLIPLSQAYSDTCSHLSLI